MKHNDVVYNRINKTTYPAPPHKSKYQKKYNTDMGNEDSIEKNDFVQQLSILRTSRNISAREMSLSLGQGPGYINNIENGKNLPSMRMFFEICRVLDITPAEFFSYYDDQSSKDKRILSLYGLLDNESQELLITLALKLRKETNNA